MSGENIFIRSAKKEDCHEIMRLIQELANYEKMPNGPKIDAKVLETDGFGPDPFFQCLVAEDNSAPANPAQPAEDSSSLQPAEKAAEAAQQLIGYALYFNTYSTWEGRSVYMEDLYVTPDFRGKGVGMRMWRWIVKTSLENGCSRCNFSVLDWNKPSIEFYNRFGAVDLTTKEGWLCFRMDKDAMVSFVKKDS